MSAGSKVAMVSVGSAVAAMVASGLVATGTEATPGTIYATGLVAGMVTCFLLIVALWRA